MHKKIIALMLAVLLCFGLSSCGKDSELTIFTPVYTKARSLDPQVASGDTAEIIAVNCYEGLVRLGENSEILPAVAESWQLSGDGLTLTLDLRQDSTWYLTNTALKAVFDGNLPSIFDSRVTARDFVFTFRRLLSPTTRAPDAELFSCILHGREALDGLLPVSEIGVTALSDFRLQFTLATPCESLLYYLARPSAAPCNEAFFNATGGRYCMDFKYMLSNGPFFLTRYNSGESYRISRSDSYVGRYKALPAAVWFYQNSDPALVPDKFEKDTYQAGVLKSGSPDELKAYTKSSFVSGNWSLIFNASDSSLQSASLRRAIVASVDKSLLSELGSTSSAHIIDSAGRSFMAKRSEPESIAFDKAAATQAARAGLRELKKSAVELVLTCLDEHEEALKNQLQLWQEALGVNIKISLLPLPLKDLLSAVRRGDYCMALYPLSCTVPEESSFYAQFHSESSDNFLELAEDDFDLICDRLRAASDTSTRLSLLAEAESYLLNNALIFPIAEAEGYYVQQKKLSGIYLSPDGRYIYYNSLCKNQKGR